jgi:hypothetical protein
MNKKYLFHFYYRNKIKLAILAENEKQAKKLLELKGYQVKLLKKQKLKNNEKLLQQIWRATIRWISKRKNKQ